jgi:hypothetical protein
MNAAVNTNSSATADNQRGTDWNMARNHPEPVT